jgi:predicted metal-dependent phosphoesterase TrpH
VSAPRAAGAPAAEVDLHMHSTASDGGLPPSEVVAAAHAAGIAAIALTDHDTMDGIAEASAAANRIGMRVVHGVELSAHDGAHEIHLLALHISHPAPLELRLSAFREARQSRAVRIVERLNHIGIPVSMDAVLVESAGGAVGRPHVARAMMKIGKVRDTREAFDRYLGAGKPGFVAKERLEIREAIEITHAAGAVAVWAHPGPDARRARLEPLVAMGLDGIEVRHPSHNHEDVLRIGALADFFKLLYSGGSDWHGAPTGVRKIGGMHVPQAWLDRQDDFIAKRNGAQVA